jgi:hypothetical protein
MSAERFNHREAAAGVTETTRWRGAYWGNRRIKSIDAPNFSRAQLLRKRTSARMRKRGISRVRVSLPLNQSTAFTISTSDHTGAP